MFRRSLGKLAMVAGLALLTIGPVLAQGDARDSFNGAHWARTTSTLNLDLGSELSNGWDRYLKRADNEWSESDAVNLRVVGSAGGCGMTRGRVEVCNGQYRNDNWLGLTIADIDGNRHIYRALVLMNDYYFDQPRYDRTDAKRHTMCQEVGHSLGLDHRYSKTCMNDREIFGAAYDSPSSADYKELADLYRHRDRDSTVSRAGVESTARSEPAEPVDAALVEDAVAKAKAARDGKGEATVVEDLGGGRSRIIHVTFVEEGS